LLLLRLSTRYWSEELIVSQTALSTRRILAGTLNEFIKMERFNPDHSWKPVLEE